jgi:hypothetical protein
VRGLGTGTTSVVLGRLHNMQHDDPWILQRVRGLCVTLGLAADSCVSYQRG